MLDPFRHDEQIGKPGALAKFLKREEQQRDRHDQETYRREVGTERRAPSRPSHRLPRGFALLLHHPIGASLRAASAAGP
jgi:hypothetical protein